MAAFVTGRKSHASERERSSERRDTMRWRVTSTVAPHAQGPRARPRAISLRARPFTY
jgi:hypothetical protein